MDLVIWKSHCKSWTREIGLVVRLMPRPHSLVIGHDFSDRPKYGFALLSVFDLKSPISNCTADLSSERSFPVTEAVYTLNYESTSSLRALAAGYGHEKSRQRLWKVFAARSANRRPCEYLRADLCGRRGTWTGRY